VDTSDKDENGHLILVVSAGERKRMIKRIKQDRYQYKHPLGSIVVDQVEQMIAAIRLIYGAVKAIH